MLQYIFDSIILDLAIHSIIAKSFSLYTNYNVFNSRTLLRTNSRYLIAYEVF